MNKRTNNLLVATVAIFFSASITLAQAPQAIPFQAAARNSSGVILANKTVALRFSVLDGQYNSMTLDTVAYQETQNAITNALGLFMVNIGEGIVGKGVFSNIYWGTNAKFIRVEMDTTGSGVNYITIATQKLMSVPYALNAGNGVPTGTIEAFAGDTSKIPIGWVLCDGSVVSTTDPKYANLYSIIGRNWTNSTISSSLFNLPYTCGVFLRGQALGRTYSDPDLASRTNPEDGTIVGDKVGSYQADAFASHDHFEFTYNGSTSSVIVNTQTTSPAIDGEYTAAGGNYYDYVINPAPTTGTRANCFPGSLTGGSETRPKNVYVNYIIKL